MKNIVLLILILAFSKISNSQTIHHDFTGGVDTVKTYGLRIFLKMDSTYFSNDTSAIKFTVIMENTSAHKRVLINPIYDTEARMNVLLYKSDGKKIQLNEASRWPYPEWFRNSKPYRLEEVYIDSEKVSTELKDNFWETEFLSLAAGEKITYKFDLYEQVLFEKDDEIKYSPLSKGKYYLSFNMIVRVGEKIVPTNPLRSSITLK